eukprot:9127330-Pyramimonas_sp.AAC.1
MRKRRRTRRIMMMRMMTIPKPTSPPSSKACLGRVTARYLQAETARSAQTLHYTRSDALDKYKLHTHTVSEVRVDTWGRRWTPCSRLLAPR